VYGLAIAEIRQFPEHIEAVTLADVERAIQELIHPQNIAIVTAGPAVSSPSVDALSG
jgi:zinc protease